MEATALTADEYDLLLPYSPSEADGIWKPRRLQKALWHYLETGGKRAIAIWHRRYGKDEIALHWASVAAHQKVGTYWHMLPEASQARKAIWEAIDPHYGKRRIDVAFPHEIRAQTRESDMFIRFKNGSTWQVVGSDNFNSLVGSPPVGIVFSEWALADPQAWAYLRPILRENKGWALFITTSRGANHAKTMYMGAKDDPTWFADIRKADETGIFEQEELAQELREYRREYGNDLGRALYNQEYMCSFEGAMLGAFYGREMQECVEDGRVTTVPYDPNLPVHTSWDLGAKDSTVIIYWQIAGSQHRAIDCDAYVHTQIKDMAKDMHAKPYSYGEHVAPHDIAVFELGAGKRIETARELGINFTVAPKLALADGIASSRSLIPRCVFDGEKCGTLVEAMSQYRAKWDIEKKALSRTPEHDWTSDYADSFRYWSVSDVGSGFGSEIHYNQDYVT